MWQRTLLFPLLFWLSAQGSLFCHNCDHTVLRQGETIVVQTSSYNGARKLSHIPVEQSSPPDCPVPSTHWYEATTQKSTPTLAHVPRQLTMFRRGTNHTLGQLLLGTNFQLSPMWLRVKHDIEHEQACVVTSSTGVCKALRRIDEFKLKATWYLDGVPSLYTNRERRFAHFNPQNETWHAMVEEDIKRESNGDVDSFEVGFPAIPTDQFAEDGVYVWTHYHLRVYYQHYDANIEHTYVTIVGFEVVPTNPRKVLCDRHDRYEISYSARWIRSSMSWDSRSKLYLYHHKHVLQVQVEAMFTGLLMMGVVVALSFSWVRHKLGEKEQDQNKELIVEENGTPTAASSVKWRNLGADVMRPPPHPELWAAFTGVGAHFLSSMLVIALSAALFSFYIGSEASIVEVAVVASSIMFLFNGYVSVASYRKLHREMRTITADGVSTTSTICTVNRARLIAPVVCLGWGISAVTCLGFFGMIEKVLQDAESVAFITWDSVVMGSALWLTGSSLFAIIGATLALYRATVVPELPYAISKEPPPAVPESRDRRWAMVTMCCCIAAVCYLIGGVFVGALFQSIWGMYVYAMYGALVFAGLAFCFLSAIGACVFTFLLVRWEDYRWWWRAPLVGSVSTILFFLSSIVYILALSPLENTHALALAILESAIVCTAVFFSLFFVCSEAAFRFVQMLYFIVKNKSGN